MCVCVTWCVFSSPEAEDGPSIDGLSTSPRASIGETLPPLSASLVLLQTSGQTLVVGPSIRLGAGTGGVVGGQSSGVGVENFWV